jgi:hypothetical protein
MFLSNVISPSLDRRIANSKKPAEICGIHILLDILYFYNPEGGTLHGNRPENPRCLARVLNTCR